MMVPSIPEGVHFCKGFHKAFFSLVRPCCDPNRV